MWGRAGSSETITVTMAAASVRVHADTTGGWSAVLPAMPAGGPFVLTAVGSSGGRQSVGDLLVGDVFLCSGQSNMELPVARTGDALNEINNSGRSTTIRMLTIPHEGSPTPLPHFNSELTWEVAGPGTVPEWSAVCFYFARELQKTVNVPLGLVHSSWGGSNIRPWLSAAALRGLGAGYDSALATLALYASDPAAAQREFGGQWEAWWRAKTGEHAGAEPWNLPWSAGSGWQTAPHGLGDWRTWGRPELSDFTGLLWYRTRIELTAAQASAATQLDLGPINQVDQTWINGRVVGNTFGYGTQRHYPIPPGLLHAGENILVVNVLSTYGGGGLLGGGGPRALRLGDGTSLALDGLAGSNGAPWQYRMVPAAIGYPPRAPWEPVGGLTTLYNGMIAPLGRYGLRGVLWYQGESNTGEPESYQALLSALLADWRRQFGSALPFLVVQLPNYGPPQVAPGVESGWAALREAQRRAVMDDPRAALAVTIDIGEPRNLHPTNKQDVGRRLARAARHVIYGESIPPSGPLVIRAILGAPGRVVVAFTDIEGGLVAYSHDEPIGFETCGDSPQSCRYAQAHIDGTHVWLSVPPGVVPTRVRYCWADSPVCTLFDRSGAPAGPFEVRIGSSNTN